MSCTGLLLFVAFFRWFREFLTKLAPSLISLNIGKYSVLICVCVCLRQSWLYFCRRKNQQPTVSKEQSALLKWQTTTSINGSSLQWIRQIINNLAMTSVNSSLF